MSAYKTRIYVVGASSTGKTTLCDELAKYLIVERGAYIKEIARNVLKKQGFTREHVGTLAMQQAIMNAQLRKEAEIQNQYDVQLFDRSAIDPIVYAILTATDRIDAQSRKLCLMATTLFGEALERYKSGYFVLLTPVEEWLTDDGVRSMENQEGYTKVFRELLKELGIAYKELGEETRSMDVRIQEVLHYVEAK